MIPYSPGINSWTFFVNGRPVRISVSDPRYEDIYKALIANDEEKVKSLLDCSSASYTRQIARKIISETFGNITFSCDEGSEFEVYWNGGVPIPGCLAKHLIALYNVGCRDFSHFTKFIENILANPSETSRKELFQFLDYKQLSITKDGTFIAYKGIAKDMYSVTGNKDTRVISGKVDDRGRILNQIGTTISVVPEDVDNDRERHCSYGLHVGSWDYASHFGSITIAVEVNPRDVVSVPSDCQCQKCRVSSYKVLGTIEREMHSPTAEIDDDYNAVEGDVPSENCNADEFTCNGAERDVTKLFESDDSYEVYNIVNNYLLRFGKATIAEIIRLFDDDYDITAHEMISGLLALGFDVDMNHANPQESIVR